MSEKQKKNKRVPDLPLFSKHRLIICIGPGGVGKTTCSASLALAAAKQGRKTLVCTLDPAHRLASAMGLTNLPHHPKQLPTAHLQKCNLPPDLPLYAMQLDIQTAFDESLRSGGLSKDGLRTLNKNKLYRRIVDDLEDIQAYAAVAQMLNLCRDEQWETIILDTPPTRHVRYLLKAPRMLIGGVKSPLFKYLLAPATFTGKVGMRIVGKQTVNNMAAITGMAFLQDIRAFIKIISKILDSLINDAQRAESLLSSRSTAYLIVTVPTLSRVKESLSLGRQLMESKMNHAGFLVNKFHPIFPIDSKSLDETTLTRQISSSFPENERPSIADCQESARALLKSHTTYTNLVEEEARVLQMLYQESKSNLFLLTVPLLSQDLGFLVDLLEISDKITNQLRRQSQERVGKKKPQEKTERKK